MKKSEEIKIEEDAYKAFLLDGMHPDRHVWTELDVLTPSL